MRAGDGTAGPRSENTETMNLQLLGPIITGLGLIVNTVWTIVNMKMREDFARQIAELKEWIGHEFVRDEVCKMRHGVAD